MNRLIRALIAAWGAKKIGGGCLTTIIVFFIIYYALGTCNHHPAQRNSQLSVPLPKTAVIHQRDKAPEQKQLYFSIYPGEFLRHGSLIVEIIPISGWRKLI